MQIDVPNPSSDESSYMQTLLSTTQFTYLPTTCHTNHHNLDLTYESNTLVDSEDFIPLSSSDKSRLYLPWQFAVIVKVFGKKVGHQALKQKLIAIWKPSEELPIIDLGSDFYLIKFLKEENLNRALHDGPWFVFNHFLPVRRWKPKFIASSAQLTYSAIWLRLPELPTEFYDMDIL